MIGAPKSSPCDGVPACAGLHAWHWRRWLYFAPTRRRGRARSSLPSRGTSPCSDDLKQLVEDFEKDQPLSGDSLALLQGAQAVLAQVNAALRSRGFYDARRTATIDNHPIDEAAALDAIEAHPEAEQIAFALTVDTGPRFKIGGVAIHGAGRSSLPAIDMSKLGLAAGDPADAAAILAAEDQSPRRVPQAGLCPGRR